MAGLAYACQITEENMSAISSEKPGFNLEETRAWLQEHEKGYFIRDEDSRFDCNYIPEHEFLLLYSFETSDRNELFRRVLRL